MQKASPLAVHDEIQIVDAPVDQRAAAGGRVTGEVAAEARNGPVGAEGSVNVVHVAQLPFLDIFFDIIDRIGVAVAHADGEDAAGFIGDLFHLQRFGQDAGGGLFAEHVLAVTHEVDGNNGVHVVVGTHRHRVELRVVQDLMVIVDRLAAAVLCHGGVRLFGNDIAEILDLRVFALHVVRDMAGIRDIAAADHGHLDGIFHF